jgi:hypothetical protein
MSVNLRRDPCTWTDAKQDPGQFPGYPILNMLVW